MGTIKIKNLRGIFYSGAGVLLLLITLSIQSCAKRFHFTTSSIVPAAEGTVKVKSDGNNNYSINLKVFNLADPKKLTPQKEVYVVWMETERNGVKNIGQLKTSDALFSKTLKSSLETVSAFKPTGFFITAEDYANIQYSGGQVVLETKDLSL